MKTLYIDDVAIAVFEPDGKTETLTLVHPRAAIYDLKEVREQAAKEPQPTASELLEESPLNDEQRKTKPRK